MEIKTHLHRIENIKAIHELHAAGVHHHVIAVFLTAEGISISKQDVTSIINSYDALGKARIPSRKVKALIAAKQLSQHDESLPCPV